MPRQSEPRVGVVRPIEDGDLKRADRLAAATAFLHQQAPEVVRARVLRRQRARGVQVHLGAVEIPTELELQPAGLDPSERPGGIISHQPFHRIHSADTVARPLDRQRILERTGAGRAGNDRNQNKPHPASISAAARATKRLDGAWGAGFKPPTPANATHRTHIGRSRLRGDFPRSGGALSQRAGQAARSEEHTSELQSLAYLVCRLLLEKKKKKKQKITLKKKKKKQKKEEYKTKIN